MRSRLNSTIVALSLVATFCSLLDAAETSPVSLYQRLLGTPHVVWFQNTTWKPIEVTYLTTDLEEVTVRIKKRTTAKIEFYPGGELSHVLADGEILQLRESSDGTKYRLTRGLLSRDFSLKYTVPNRSCDD